MIYRLCIGTATAIALVCSTVSAFAQPAENPERAACDAWATSPSAWNDVEKVLRENYAYLDRVDDLDGLFAQSRASAAKVNGVQELGTIVETLGYAFRDGHFHTRPSSAPERAWIPSSSDMWVSRSGGKWLVSDVKQGSKAREIGVRPGWKILQMDGVPIGQAAGLALAPVEANPSTDQLEYAVNVVMSGKLGEAREFTFQTEDGEKLIALPPAQKSFAERPAGLVQVGDIDGIAHIRFTNSLGDNALIDEFDEIMARQNDASALIIDLRDTPGGGNTTVARAILGHFISEPTPYQIHRNAYEEAVYGVRRQHTEYVFPRGKQFENPVVILAGRWTGSVGEAIAMAFDTATTARTIGTPLADLLGTLNRNQTSNGCITMRFAWDKLYSADGLPREDWNPDQLLISGDVDDQGNDPALAAALIHLGRMIE